MLKYDVITFPLAEQDIADNTDYIYLKRKSHKPH